MDDDTRARIGAQPEPANFLTPRDLQRELRIGEKLCYRLLRDGTIPSVRVGNLYRVRREALEEMRGRAAPAESAMSA